MELDYDITTFAFGVKTIVKIHHEGCTYRLMKHQFANHWELALGEDLTDMTGLVTLYKPNGEYKDVVDPDLMMRPNTDMVIEKAKNWIREHSEEIERFK